MKGSPTWRAGTGAAASGPLVLAVSLAVFLAGTGPAAGAFPGANGKIAFTCNDGDTEICLVEPDGSDLEQLTSNGANEAQAAWSADGTKLAFVSTRDGEGEIFVMDADGANQRQLTFNGLADGYPAWSPDGTKITFTRDLAGDPANPDLEIFVMNADGSGQTQLTSDEFQKFGSEWSPDGAKIAFHRGDAFGRVAIVVVNADGSGQTDLSPASALDFNPSWSPDGTKIAFDRPGVGILVMNADGSGRTTLVTGAAHEPAWSPDGTKIAFVRPNSGGTGASLRTVNADGSGEQTLASTSGAGTLLRPDWQPLVTQTAFADLSLTLEASAGKANTNKPFTYTITVENRGPATAAGVVVTDVLDPNEQFVSVTTTRGTCTAPAPGASGVVSCELGALPISEQAEITVVVDIPPKKAFGTKKPELRHAAVVGGTTVDTVTGNNAAVLVTGVVGP